MTNPGTRQSGFAAIAAIFLVVVLAALGGFMVTFSNTQQLTSAQDIQGTRAYWAARAGLEWGVASVTASATSPPGCPGTATASTSTLTETFDGGFTVTVSCSRADYAEESAVANKFIFQFTALARSASAPGSVGFVERSLSASMER